MKPSFDLIRAQRWVHLCARQGFTVDNITRNTFLCEHHFEIGANLDYRKDNNLEPFSISARKLYKPRNSRTSHKDNSSNANSNANTWQPPSPVKYLENLAQKSTKNYLCGSKKIYVPMIHRTPPNECINLQNSSGKKVENNCSCQKSKTRISDFILKNRANAKFYTGLKKEHRDSLWAFFGKAKHHLRLINSKKKNSDLKKCLCSVNFY